MNSPADPAPPQGPPSRATLILVGGGVRCGKSAFALHRARAIGARRAFLATAQAFDDEMGARIAAHKAERTDAFMTIEAPIDLAHALEALPAVDVVVIDCLTLWLSNLLMAEKDDDDVYAALETLIQAILARPWHVVLVTNEVGLGVVPASPLGRRFRDLAGRIHQRLVPHADEIYFGALGAMLRLRPEPIRLFTQHDFHTPASAQ